MTKTVELPAWIAKRIHITESGCWLWTGQVAWNGYGQIRRGSLSTSRIAHRAVYIGVIGPIADRLDLDHLCRTRLCVRPDHLEPVTRGENLRRSPLVGKHGLERTHCVRGHEFTPENTYRRTDRPGYRQCKTCNNDASRRLRRRTAA